MGRVSVVPWVLRDTIIFPVTSAIGSKLMKQFFHNLGHIYTTPILDECTALWSEPNSLVCAEAVAAMSGK